MARNLSPQCKICRREGEKLFLKGERCFSPKCAMVKKNYPPGVHGVRGRGRLTDYGLQLREKQKAKRIYGILEKQFKNYFNKAIKKTGDTGEIILRFLELRLDNVIYRLGLASSRRQARQLVNHRHFLVNNKKVNIPSYQLKAGDEIKVSEKSLNYKHFQAVLKTIKKHEIPGWLNLDSQKLRGKIISFPAEEDLEQSINMSLIVEYYSR